MPYFVSKLTESIYVIQNIFMCMSIEHRSMKLAAKCCPRMKWVTKIECLYGDLMRKSSLIYSKMKQKGHIGQTKLHAPGTSL